MVSVSDILHNFLLTLWETLNLAFFLEPIGLNHLGIAQFILIGGTLPLALLTRPFFKKFVPPEDATLPPAQPVWLRPLFYFRQSLGMAGFAFVWLLFLLASDGVLVWLELPTGYLSIAALITACWTVTRLIPLLPFSENHRHWLVIGIWVLLALSFTNQLGSVITFLNDFRISLGSSSISLWAAIKAVGIFILLLMLFSRGQTLLETNMKTRRVSPTARTLILKLINISGLVLAGLFALNTMGLDLSALAIFGGAFGLGLGFGMQTIISNYISGIILLLDKSISPGDVIEVEGNYGVITEMHARYVVMKTRAGEEMLIPNEMLLTNKVTNWSFSSRAIRQDMYVGVSYDSDMELVQKVLKDCIREHKRVLESPVPRAFIKEFGDSSVVFIVRFWMKDPEEGVNNLKGDLYMLIWRALKENNIHIPFPQRVIHMQTDDTPPTTAIKKNTPRGAI